MHCPKCNYEIRLADVELDEEKIREICRKVLNNNTKALTEMIIPSGEHYSLQDLAHAIAQSSKEIIKVKEKK